MSNKPLQSGDTEEFVIPANDTLPIAANGTFLRCLESNGTFNVRFNNSGGAIEMSAGLARYMREGEEFYNFQLINETGSDITAKVTWGFGDVQDSRLQASGNLNVQNASGGTLDVQDTAMQTLLQNDEVLRTPLTTLAGASYHTATNTTTTVITAAANTNGYIIRIGSYFSNMSNKAQILIDGNPLISNIATGGSGGGPVLVRDIFVPSGSKVEISSDNANITASLWGEAL